MICFGCWPLMAKRACIKGGFQDVHALFHIVVHSVHAKCLIKCLLGIFLLFWTPMSTELWGFLCFLTRTMFGSLVVYLTHLTSHVHFQYFGHALHVVTSCTQLYYPCHVLVYTLFFHPKMSCLPYTLQHFVLSSFELHFLIHFAPIMHHYHCSYHHLLPSFFLNPLFICDKKGESILQTTQCNRKAKSPNHPVCYKTDSSHSIHTLLYIDPYTHEMQRASRENFERETLEKNKIDSSTIFIL